VIPAPVDYVRAGSMEEALEALADPETVALAGGQSLLPLMKLRLARPGRVCDIGRLPLRGIAVEGAEARVGALATWDAIARSPELAGAQGLEALPECAGRIADLQVRNRGTIGGSCAHADPASDVPAVLVALGARLRLRSPAGERTVPAEDFFLGPFATALEPGELLLEALVPLPPEGARSAYVSVEHPASGYALAGACASVSPAGRAVALTGVAGRPTPVGANGALDDVEVFGDQYASSEYRRHLAAVVVRRALEAAEARR
jgi:carbon-monoxide dehydrogenase medium subunit